jgi:5'-nucleotidase
MKILVTNDDGIEAEGIRALAEELGAEHEVWIIAPDRERSGASHSVNLHEPARLVRKGERSFSCSGSPADCVIFSRLGVLEFIPDLVVAGINRGPNLGTDVVYSGTCGAARQAALYGIPAIAVSCASRLGPFIYDAAAAFVRRHLEQLASYCSDSVFMNVNAPSVGDREVEGRWAGIARRYYHDAVNSSGISDGEFLCSLLPGKVESVDSPSSDESVVSAGYVAVSPVLVQPQVSGAARPGEIFR